MADALVRETQRLYGLPRPGEPETGRVLPTGVEYSERAPRIVLINRPAGKLAVDKGESCMTLKRTFGVIVSLAIVAMLAALPAAAGKSKWDVYTYVGEDGPFESQAANPKGKAIAAFDFLLTPDRALLLTDDKSYLPKKGDLRGRTIEATIAIDAPAGTTFNYYGEPDGCLRAANVRLYFETTNDALGESQYWWSNPISIDLLTLAALGDAGTTLSVGVEAANWSDRDGHFGTFDAAHTAAFDAAAANVTTTGLSFGGGCNFAFGTGSDPAGATFELVEFSTD